MRTCDGAAANSSVYKQGMLVCLGAAVFSSASTAATFVLCYVGNTWRRWHFMGSGGMVVD